METQTNLVIFAQFKKTRFQTKLTSLDNTNELTIYNQQYNNLNYLFNSNFIMLQSKHDFRNTSVNIYLPSKHKVCNPRDLFACILSK